MFPKWKYHAEKAPLIVKTREEEAALGDGWAESPADLHQEQSSGPMADDHEAYDHGDASIDVEMPHAPKKKPGRKPKVSEAGG